MGSACYAAPGGINKKLGVLEGVPMTSAIFLNGVFESVLSEIIQAQKGRPELICYLQPYSQSDIVQLRRERPTIDEPVELYLSTTVDLGNIRYRGLIVDWESKGQISSERLAVLNSHISKFQPGEEEIYLVGDKGQRFANLLSIAALEELSLPLPVGCLVKTSDGSPMKKRSRAGGWSYVHQLPEWLGTEATVIQEAVEKELEDGLRNSAASSDSARRERLSKAKRIPERIQVLSVGYRRNPDVIIEVLKRANGVCELCHGDAPFLRASDGTPYLEVHHIETLARGGEDVAENALALCPKGAFHLS